MPIKQQLVDDMKQAMRDKNMTKLGVIRFLLSDIKNVEIDSGEQNDESIQAIIAKEIKAMRDAVTDYLKAERQDLIDAENAKIEILQAYLPQQLSEEALRTIVKDVIVANPGQQMGPIIGQVLAKVKGQAEGSRVSQLVKELL